MRDSGTAVRRRGAAAALRRRLDAPSGGAEQSLLHGAPLLPSRAE